MSSRVPWGALGLLLAAATCVAVAVCMEQLGSESILPDLLFWPAAASAPALFFAGLAFLFSASVRSHVRAPTSPSSVCPACAERLDRPGRCRVCGERA